ncbi:MAG: type I-C CRISPR-associated protein Cas8c/Csd1 [Opitutales bacterium]|nr:type I-C CRISPR-associated protein Cas8c/Csd1 [Opitutales bacterium]
MILQSLAQFYDRLSDDPEQSIPAYGFTEGKVTHCVVISKDGDLIAIDDIRDTSGKKPFPRKERVPDCGVRSSGIRPNVLCDGSAYIFGYVPEGPKPDPKREKVMQRALSSFEAFKERHLELESAINHPSYAALCRFLEKWNPSAAETHPMLVDRWNDLVGATFVFRMEDDVQFLHRIPEIRSAWQTIKQKEASSGEDDQHGQCLVSGHEEPLERVHSSIKGVLGAQSSGAAVISFNAAAFTSYSGKDRTALNAPVGKSAAFKYTTALNWLLNRDNRHVIQIGDASTVFWCDAPTTLVNAWGAIMRGDLPAEDEETIIELRSAMEYLSGKRQGFRDLEDMKVGFHILGLSPNAARISLRFSYESTLGEAYECLKKHYDDLRIERQFGDNAKHPDPLFPAPWQLLRETARESKEIPPVYDGALMRAILTGGQYPLSIYTAILRRISLDKRVNYLRVSMLKAVLVRNFKNQSTKNYFMSLDTTSTNVPYLLGRLFAVFEKAQLDGATPNKTIKDSYFTSAASTPSAIFPRLIQLNQHHMRKLKSPSDMGRYVTNDKLIAEISDLIGLDAGKVFPARLSLEDQGVFAIGYYHQRNDLYRSKKDTTTTEIEN